VVIEVGAEVETIKVGDKVVTTGAHGSHAELRAVPARTAWVIPPGMDIQHAAVVPVPFGTADDCLFSRPVRPASASPPSSSPRGPARPWCWPPPRPTSAWSG
jgi:NADPH:quinone reductase-like Zn-dependent oxidoreductase